MIYFPSSENNSQKNIFIFIFLKKNVLTSNNTVTSILTSINKIFSCDIELLLPELDNQTCIIIPNTYLVFLQNNCKVNFKVALGKRINNNI